MEKVNIEEKGQEKWRKLYRYEIPVLHLKSKFLMKNRFDKHVLEKRLLEIENNDDEFNKK